MKKCNRLLFLFVKRKLILLPVIGVIFVLSILYFSRPTPTSPPLPSPFLPPDHFFMNLSETELLTRCMWGEAREESVKGKLAIAHVVMNRLKARSWYGKTVHEVILKPFQFSCFNPEDPNYIKMMEASPDDPRLVICRRLAVMVLKGLSPDLTGGATHFHAFHVNPPWRKQMAFTGRIGKHLFYREKGDKDYLFAARVRNSAFNSGS